VPGRCSAGLQSYTTPSTCIHTHAHTHKHTSTVLAWHGTVHAHARCIIPRRILPSKKWKSAIFLSGPRMEPVFARNPSAVCACPCRHSIWSFSPVLTIRPVPAVRGDKTARSCSMLNQTSVHARGNIAAEDVGRLSRAHGRCGGSGLPCVLLITAL
jgi:hypothetical protein